MQCLNERKKKKPFSNLTDIFVFVAFCIVVLKYRVWEVSQYLESNARQGHFYVCGIIYLFFAGF